MTQPLLNRWKVSDLCDSNSPIYTVGKKAAIKEVFQLLTDKKILSVPIYDNRAGKYKTFVDILDLLVYIVKIVGNDSIGSGYETISSHPKFTANCAELADGSHRNPFVPIDQSMSLATAIERMNKNKVHRLAVVNASGELSDLFSQSDVLRFFSQHLTSLPFDTSKTVGELSLGYREVITVPMGRTVFYAFEEIIKHSISGIGVTNEDGTLIANLSASDLKKVGYDNLLLSNMFLSIDKFLALGNEGGLTLYTVSPKDTVADVIRKFVKHKVHRLFIMDGDTTKGVITLGDILALVPST